MKTLYPTSHEDHLQNNNCAELHPLLSKHISKLHFLHSELLWDCSFGAFFGFFFNCFALPKYIRIPENQPQPRLVSNFTSGFYLMLQQREEFLICFNICCCTCSENEVVHMKFHTKIIYNYLPSTRERTRLNSCKKYLMLF